MNNVHKILITTILKIALSKSTKLIKNISHLSNIKHSLRKQININKPIKIFIYLCNYEIDTFNDNNNNSNNNKQRTYHFYKRHNSEQNIILKWNLTFFSAHIFYFQVKEKFCTSYCHEPTNRWSETVSADKTVIWVA